MSPHPLEQDPESARLATDLLRHLEWCPDRFSLLFLFADVGPANALADWLNLQLVSAHASLQQQHPDASFVHEPDAHAEAMIGMLSDFAAKPGAVWYVLNRHPSDEQWTRARRVFLARLNERRFLLERDLPRPLILVLPVAFRTETQAIAPDLWSVRARSDELRAKTTPRFPEVDIVRAPAVPSSDHTNTGAAYAEWLRVMMGPRERVNLAIAYQAVSELLDAGRIFDAEIVAKQARDLANERVVAPSTSLGPLRDVSVSLDNVGRVAEAQGNWGEAEGVYRESLSIRRQLQEWLDGTPQSLRDVSVSLNNVGRVAEAQGNWGEAEGAYRESLSISRQLRERLGGTPESLRDVSISLNNVGRVAEAQGNWGEAEGVYREGLSIRRQLAERVGGTPESLRDVSISLDNVGRVAAAQGNWGEAEGGYRESLSIRRQLAERVGGTPGSLRDVSVSLTNVGRVAEAQGNLGEAEGVYREGLSISRQLQERLGGTPESLDDVGVALVHLGDLDRRRNVEMLNEALSIYRDLASRYPGIASYRERLDLLTKVLSESAT